MTDLEQLAASEVEQRISKAVESARKERGWTRLQLAEEGGISKSTVDAIEAGQRSRLQPKVIAGLEYAFGWPEGEVDRILVGQDSSPSEVGINARSYRRGEVSRNIAANIRRLRAVREWSVAQLAEECEKYGAAKLSEALLGNVERGQDLDVDPSSYGVTAEDLFVLADLFGVTVDEIAKHTPCSACEDKPPAGFTCNACGTSA